MYVFILNKVFQFHQIDSSKQTHLGLPSLHSTSDRNLQSVHRTHFCRCSKTIEARSILGIFFVSLACIFGLFFLIFVLCFWSRFCFLFFRPSSFLVSSEPSVVLGVRAFLTAVSVILTVVLLFCLKRMWTTLIVSCQTDTDVCLLTSRQQYLFDKCLLQYAQSWTPDDGRKDRPKHVVSFQNTVSLRHRCIWLVLL